MIENFLKYGVRTNFWTVPASWQDLKDNFPILFTLVLLHCPFFFAFFLEKYVLQYTQHRRWLAIGTQGVIGLNALSVIITPPVVIRYYPEANPLTSVAILCCSIVWFLKLWSLHHVLLDTRRILATGGDFGDILGAKETAKFPQSLTFGAYYTFLCMPTMCFQFAYPRTDRIRPLYILRYLAELVLCVILIKLLVDQYTLPILQNTFLPMEVFRTMSKRSICLHFAERLLKLSVPNVYIWLLFFYAVFHCWLNVLAEVTRFGDRCFYLDWWNSAGFDEYWRKWNLPIHCFFNRHVYKPLLRRGFSRVFTVQIVFVISAAAHEFLVYVPFRLGFTGLIPAAFILQAPLCALTSADVFKRRRAIGNALFWFVFCFSGQPVSLMVYYYLWGVKTGVQNPVSFSELLL